MAPGTSMQDLGKTIGSMWKGLSESDRAVYEAQAAQDAERHRRDVAACESSIAAAEAAHAAAAQAGC